MKIGVLFTFLAFSISFSSAQVVTIDPVFATQNDSVTIYFDASQGNGNLAGVVPVYAHTGVITNSSNGPSDWKNVQGNWGVHDPKVLMTYLGNNIHKISFKIQDFYLLNSTDTVYSLAFVFRNGNGSKVGRNADGSDIYIPIYTQSFAVNILNLSNGTVVNLQDTFNFKVACSDSAHIQLFIDGTPLGSTVFDVLQTQSIAAATYGTGKHYLSYEVSYDTSVLHDSVHFITHGQPMVQNPPAGIEDGINYWSDSSVILQLFAPQKEFVYAIGDFSNWELAQEYFMHQTTDSSRFWIQIDGVNPDKMYRFQYQIGTEAMRIADIYSELVLSPWDDGYIQESTFPNMPPFPTDTTNQIVGVFQINSPEFVWNNDAYVSPNPKNLIIYELLIRDFTENHDYSTLLDSLSYLSNLGVNAIELMPVNEFEGNISWGYNPSFYFAPDKYYGPAVDFKTFVDSCHGRGIAVIMDIALNHSFGQNPQVRMYFNPNAGQWGQPTPNNPWFNEVAKHDFNVGYDYNHESPETRKFMKRILNHWVNAYHIDGYRLDLSKGFTQKNTLGNTSAWGEFDSSRVAILEDYQQSVLNNNSKTILILEHLADNSEEKYLSSKGFLLWGNLNYQYNEATMGYPSDLGWASYQNRQWAEPNLVTYSSSHDEERLMFKNIHYGYSNGSYNIKNLETGLARVEMANLFLYPIPGPKMIWQFDEVGYDYSINTCEDGTIDPNCRIAPKPIRWDYTTDSARVHLYNVTRELFLLKKKYPVFSTSDFQMNVNGFWKRIVWKDPSMNAVALGNFHVIDGTISGNFPHTGIWYSYFSGDSISVTDVNASIPLAAGEYHLYLDQKLPLPDLNQSINTAIPLGILAQKTNSENSHFNIFPNPARESIQFEFLNPTNQLITMEWYDTFGRKVATPIQNKTISGVWMWQIPAHISAGMYIVSVRMGNTLESQVVLIE